MPDIPERRSATRRSSTTRILWSVAGQHDLQIDRLRDVSTSGALVSTSSFAKVGAEIRFDVLDEDGVKFGSGVARVAWSNPAKGMGIEFLALGVDPALVTKLGLVAGTSADAKPPPLPGALGGPPPMPGERAAVAIARDADEVIEIDVSAADVAVEPLAVARPRVIIGIDLGTTNTCASHVVDGRPTIIRSRTGTNTIPSMITFDADGTWHVGQRAADRHVLHPLRTVYGSKRLLGRTYRPDLAAELQKHFAYPLAEAEGQRFGARIDDRVISMDTVATRVLEEVRGTAEAELGVAVDAAVITVPAYFSEVQRDAVRRAARDAKLTVHRIVNEPTAAAVAYGHKQKGQRARVAVWDFGGGTFDFSVVDVDGGQLEVVATGGDNFLGGSDFDDLLASHLLAEFQRAEKVELDPDPQQIARLREAAEQAKLALSVEPEHLVELPEFTREPKRALRVAVTRQEFDELTRPLVQRAVGIAVKVMTSQSMSPTAVDDVLLVGGTTRIPAVQRAVAELFQRRPSKRINPDEAVSLGAALLADEIGSGSAPTLLDILPISVGYGTRGLRFVSLVARNSRLPAQRDVTLEADFLGSVTMPLFQGESADVSKSEYLFSAVVEDRALQDKGRVTMTLSFDEHCVLTVEAKNARTGDPLSVRVDRARPLAEVLEELGTYDGPPEAETWKLPESRIGKALGKLFKLFGR